VREQSTAFVLAGGGTKGAFEAGALSFLVEECGVVPDVITATSAGAITGAVLAQGRSMAEFAAATDDLREDLLAMTHTEMLFAKQPWVAELDGTPFGRVIDDYITDRIRPPIPGEDLGPIVGGVPTRPAGGRSWGRLLAGIVKSLPKLPPARRGLRANPSSMLTLDPLTRALSVPGTSGIRPIDPALIARPGIELRLAVLALGAGVLRYVTQDGTIVESDAVTPVAGAGRGPVPLLEGVMASASVPMVFPPRSMADDVYVDGGVLQNIPVEAAARLGATRIFAIVAIPLTQPRDERDFASMNMVGVFLRSVGAVAFADRQLANLRYPLPPSTELTVIDPLLDIVGPFEVAQGLMILDMDYGWLRAADVMAEVTDDVRAAAEAATDAAVTARTQSWHLEEALWSGGRPRASQLRSLARLKATVRDNINERKSLGLPTPPDANRWWEGYEGHSGARPPALLANPLDALD
jgi:predicted acylesterase/phospholipase RssA